MEDPVARLACIQREFGEYGGVNPSIEISTTFSVLEAKTLPDIFAGERGPERKKGACYLYGRSWSPTVHTLGRQLAALEATEAAYAVSSGMAAISSSILALCNSGDHVVCSNVVYGGTFAFMKSFLPLKCGITVLFTEVVSNPTLVVADLPRLAGIAHRRGAQLVVDNTFTPLAISPVRWGADVVVHSMTKFISGASDIIAGAVCGTAAFLERLMDLHTGPVMLQGPTMDPRIASELMLRLPHLGLRVAEHSRRAAAMADMLQGLGAKVVYPGLPSHKQYEVLKRMLNPGYGAGGLLGLDMGSPAKAEAIMERLQNKHSFGLMAVSLGYADTLMSLSAASTSSELSPADKEAADISDGYVRLSVGITGTLEQRLVQLREAFEFVTRYNGHAPYRATKVQRQPNGQHLELVSWPSSGPQEDGCYDSCAVETDEEAEELQAAATGPQGVLAHFEGDLQAVDPGAAAVVAAALNGAAGETQGQGQPHLARDGGMGSGSGSASPPPAAALASSISRSLSRNRSRLAEGLDASGRLVKVRKLDDDTHVVYTQLG
eukprot:gene12376-12510_t